MDGDGGERQGLYLTTDRLVGVFMVVFRSSCCGSCRVRLGERFVKRRMHCSDFRMNGTEFCL